MLIALARRERPIDDRAYDHLAECSPCYLEVRALKERADLRRRRILTWAAAAALVLATASVGWFSVNRTSGIVGPGATEVRTRLDLRPYALTRGEPPASDRPRLVLPRARAALTLILPVGSEPGPYEVQIRDLSAVSKVSARGNAVVRSQVTTLEVTFELESLSGAYQLSVRRDGQEWQLFPVQVESRP